MPATHRHGDMMEGGGVARILVVEDDPTLRQLLRELLDEEGYTVLEASNGAAALAVVQQQHPDLVVMDMRLPGLDGETATRHLKADPRTTQIPIIAMSVLWDQYSGPTDLLVETWLAKPFEPEALLAAVRQAIT
jgi:CheY-like chemotaxis protein